MYYSIKTNINTMYLIKEHHENLLLYTLITRKCLHSGSFDKIKMMIYINVCLESMIYNTVKKKKKIRKGNSYYVFCIIYSMKVCMGQLRTVFYCRMLHSV